MFVHAVRKLRAVHVRNARAPADAPAGALPSYYVRVFTRDADSDAETELFCSAWSLPSQNPSFYVPREIASHDAQAASELFVAVHAGPPSAACLHAMHGPSPLEEDAEYLGSARARVLDASAVPGPSADAATMLRHVAARVAALSLPIQCGSGVLSLVPDLRRALEEGEAGEPVLEQRVALTQLSRVANRLDDVVCEAENTVLLQFSDGWIYVDSSGPSANGVSCLPSDYEEESLQVRRQADIVLTPWPREREVLRCAVQAGETLHQAELDTMRVRSLVSSQLSGQSLDDFQLGKLRMSARRCADLRNAVQLVRGNNDQLRQQVASLRDSLLARTARIEQAHKAALESRKVLRRQELLSEALKQRVYVLVKLLAMKRRDMVRQLGFVFTISQTNDSALLCIRDLALPMMDIANVKSWSDEVVSSALGYVVLCVTKLSKYLHIPLRFPMRFFGSRSFVFDPVHFPPEDATTFPLYLKDVSRENFERGVFLLSSNVLQLLSSQNLTARESRKLLHNLLTLMSSDNIGLDLLHRPLVGDAV